MLNLLLTIAIFAIYTLAIRWAAMYAGAADTSYRSCCILSVASSFIRFAVYSFFSSSFFTPLILSPVISVIVCMKVLTIRSENFFDFAIILLLLHMVTSLFFSFVIKGIFDIYPIAMPI